MKQAIPFLVIAGILVPNMIALSAWDTFKISAHPGLVCLAFNQGGTKLASASDDGTMQLWEISGKNCILSGEFAGHENPNGGKFTVYSLSFSPNGDFLASGSRDGKVKIWDVSTKDKQGELSHGSAIRSISISSSNGKTLLVSGGDDNKIRIWDVSDLSNLPTTPRNTLLKHTSPVLSVCFSRDGNLLASGSSDGKVKLWSVETGEEIDLAINVNDHEKSVNSVSFGPNELLASGSDDRRVKIWDTSTISQGAMTLQDTLESVVRVKSVSFSKDKILAFESSLNCISLWDLSENPKENIKNVDGSGKIVEFAHNGNILAYFSTGNDKIVFCKK